MKKIIAFALAACLCLALAMTASAEGSVYYLNFKPEQDAQWQERSSTPRRPACR